MAGELIVIEGIDGLGKTTVAQEVARRKGFTYFTKDVTELKAIPKPERALIDPMRRFLYYLSAYMDVSEMVRRSEGGTFVTDRYTTSMQVYSSKLAGRDLTHLIEEFGFTPPSTRILLVGDEGIRSSRVDSRSDGEKSDWDEKIQASQRLSREIQERFYRFCHDFTPVVNTGRPLDETVDEICSIVDGDFIDLHVHTSVMDGVLSPAEVIKAAARINLRAMGITDHDTVEGIAEARRYAEMHGIELVTGFETSAKEAGYSIHLLGYLFDETNARLLEVLREQRELRKNALLEKVEGLKGLGFDVDFDTVYAESRQKFLGKKNLCFNILNNPANNARVHRYVGGYERPAEIVDELKDALFERPESPLKHCKTPTVKVSEVIAAIHGAGGLAFLAHPYLRLKEDVEPDLDGLIPLGLDGVETTTTFTPIDRTARLLVAAANRGLLCSGGSNYHDGWEHDFSERQDIGIGFGETGNMRVPYHFLKRMKDRLGG